MEAPVHMRKLLVVFFVFLVGSISNYHIYSADLFVPTFNVVTRGYMESGKFVLGARGTIDLKIEGGYKFGGRLILNIESDNLEDFSTGNLTNAVFKSAGITARELFTIPMDLTYFVGELENFCSGDTFYDFFGAIPFASQVRGFQYFPSGIRYNGIYTPVGTGISISTSPGFSDVFRLDSYIYQDSNLEKGQFSADIRMLLNLELFKLETFVGASFPVSDVGLYRGGLLMYYKTGGSIGEFLTQIGIPRYDPWKDPFTIDLFYFLFEPRVKISFFSIILTLFWHPTYYNQTMTGEVGTADIYANFRFGDITKNPISGGIENNLTFGTTADKQFRVIVAPYFSAITSGVLWSFKVKTKVFPFQVDDLIEAFVGVKAEF